MGRQPRLIVPDWPVHIVQRGNDRMVCFRGDSDYLVYLALLHMVSAKTGCAVHAYCLMSNHVHLLATPATSDACSIMMKALAQRYAYYFNRKYARTGPLWDGRFRSCLVDSGLYVLACYRYVELNPVRAGIVSHPEAYRWSSYAANAGSRMDPLITRHAEVSALATSAYIRLFGESLSTELTSEIREATNAGLSLMKGSAEQGRPGRPPKNGSATSEGKSVSDTDLFSGGGVS